MKRKFTRHRGICPNFFSTDKHWVFILLIASSFVLFSLLFVLLNQTPSLNSSYALIKSNQLLNSNSTSSVKSNQNSVTTLSDTLPQIKRIFQNVYSGQITMAKNSSNVNFYTSKNISFYANQNTTDVKYELSISAYEYVPGKNITSLVDGKKVTTKMDNWINWLSTLKPGTQTTKLFSDVENGTKTIAAQAKKIGQFIYFINDYPSSSAKPVWIREYTTYDSAKKQIISITLNTQQPVKTGTKTVSYEPFALKTFAQIESLISSLPN